jgi:hypothetical protein
VVPLPKSGSTFAQVAPLLLGLPYLLWSLLKLHQVIHDLLTSLSLVLGCLCPESRTLSSLSDSSFACISVSVVSWFLGILELAHLMEIALLWRARFLSSCIGQFALLSHLCRQHARIYKWRSASLTSSRRFFLFPLSIKICRWKSVYIFHHL